MRVNKNPGVITINPFDANNRQASFTIAYPLRAPHWQALEADKSTKLATEHMRDCRPSCTQFAINAAWFEGGRQQAHPSEETMLAIARSVAARVQGVLSQFRLDIIIDDLSQEVVEPTVESVQQLNFREPLPDDLSA